MDLGVGGLLVHVLQKEREIYLLGIVDHALQPFEAGFHAGLDVTGEVKACMDHHPFAA